MSAGGLSSRAIQGKFFKRLEMAPAGWVGDLSAYFTSDQGSEEYKWLGQAPTMREWKGGRQEKGVRENGLTIKNVKYESTLGIDGDDFRRDKTGQIQVRINEQADRAASHWAGLLSTLVLNGASTVCYDGEYFFDTDHKEGLNTTNQSNSISVDISEEAVAHHGSVSNPSVEEMRNVILKGIQAILGFKDDQNEPMNENARMFRVMCPTSLWTQCMGAVGLPTLGGGATNLLASLDGFSIGVEVNPRLSSWTDKVAIFRADGSVKPFIRQEEYDPEPMMLDESSEYYKLNDKLLFGLKASRGVGYGYWQHAILTTMT